MSEGNGRVVTLLRIASELRTRLDWQATASEVEAAASDVKQLSRSLAEAREALRACVRAMTVPIEDGGERWEAAIETARNLLDANAREETK